MSESPVIQCFLCDEHVGFLVPVFHDPHEHDDWVSAEGDDEDE